MLYKLPFLPWFVGKVKHQLSDVYQTGLTDKPQFLRGISATSCCFLQKSWRFFLFLSKLATIHKMSEKQQFLTNASRNGLNLQKLLKIQQLTMFYGAFLQFSAFSSLVKTIYQSHGIDGWLHCTATAWVLKSSDQQVSDFMKR